MTVKEFLGLTDLKPKHIFDLFRALLAEFLGTLLIVFVGCGCSLNFITRTDIVQLSFGFGLAVLASVHFAAPVSGGHLNPALTLSLLVAGRVNLLRAILYGIFQCLGAIAGAGLLYFVTPRVHRGRLGLNQLHPGTYHPNCSSEESDTYCYIGRVSPYEGFGVELICTFLLALVALSEGSSINSPLAVGLAVVVCHLLAIPYTGCGINPARNGPHFSTENTLKYLFLYLVLSMSSTSLGPAVVSQDYTDLQVYWLGPLVGGLLAAVVYCLLYSSQARCGRRAQRDEYDLTPAGLPEHQKLTQNM